MADNTRGRERDLILAPNEYAFLLDETKGNVINYVGPNKTSLANTDQPVVWSAETKRFERCNLEEAIRSFAIAPEGWYLVLKNPARDGTPPTPGTANSLPPLQIGRKVNLPGPVAFALWPGQMVRVIPGHHLRSNQYLMVRVYDEEAARANWAKAVIKPQTAVTTESGDAVQPVVPPVAEGKAWHDISESDLTMGKLLVIRGTDVSFYIPPTGIEVVRDGADNYVREAVTLERLEYCILLDEDGNKRFIQGPAVVFPRPSETFVIRDGMVKHRAIELNEISGLYIKVIAPYQEQGRVFAVGEELFVTGKEQMIYFPRPEHAIIRYGERDVHYGVAIPAGEARYVLDRLSGTISLKRGPCMFLPDPRKEVIVRRVLDPRQVSLWFPGNTEALEYNQRLLALTAQNRGQDYVRDGEARGLFEGARSAPVASVKAEVKEKFVGDEFARRQTFTPPRTITLDTKYEGAVTLNIWTGYAVQLVSKTSRRRVLVGPTTHLLEYDESMEPVELSTGTPKTDEELYRTVYLRVLHNKVSDLVEAETRDLVGVGITVSYRVNFEGEPDRWFNVENYVKFLTDHMRSLLRHAVRQHGIERFYPEAISIVRDTVLGLPDETGKRPGRVFPENGMRIYDVEVLDVVIRNSDVDQLLGEAQRYAVSQSLELQQERLHLETTRQKELIKQQVSTAEAQTLHLSLDLQGEELRRRLGLRLAQIEADVNAARRQLEAKLAEQQPLDAIHAAELGRRRTDEEQAVEMLAKRLVLRLDEVRADVQAVVEKAKAVTPDLVAALQAFSDRALTERVAQSMAPLAILGGKSVSEVLGQLLKGTALERLLPQKTE